MAHQNYAGKVWPFVVAALCLGFFSIRAISSLTQESATFDETTYFGLGKYLLKYHRWDVPGAILHPPLSFYIHSIPLMFAPTDEHVWDYDSAPQRDLQFLGTLDYARGQALLSSPANQGDRLLDLARAMMVLPAVFLGWFVFLWSRTLYGNLDAILAIVLYSFSPNILAHARLITPDILVTTFTFVTVYYFWRWHRYGRMANAIMGGVCLGLALLSKFTAILLLPICLVLALLWRMRGSRVKIGYYLIFAIIGVAILFLGYGMDLNPYLDGIVFQRERSVAGGMNYLMGHYSNQGWWDYFIVAFLIKTPLPTLIFLAVALACFIVRVRQGQWIDETFLLAPVVVIFGFFSLSHAQLGLRYILPVYPFLFVLASRAANVFLSDRLKLGFCLAMLGWLGTTSCLIHPHYLAYFNELVGGPNNGSAYLVDSNLDWGQDLKGLKQFMDKHGIDRISLSYFGTDSPARYGIKYNWLPSMVLNDPDPANHSSAPKGWIAVSATNLRGAYFRDPNLFDWLKNRKPIARIGYSIFIFNVP